MIKPGALVMAVLMTGVTAGTYYGLDSVPPELLGATLGRAPKPEPPPPGAQDTYTEGVGMRRTATNVEQLARVGAEDPMTEADLAEAPPPEPAPAEAAPQAAAEPAAAAAPQAEPKPVEPEPTPTPAQAAAPAPKPAPEASASTSRPKPQPAPSQPTTVTRAPAAGEPTGPVKPKPPEADVIKPWWPDPAKMPANQLKLQYAGQVQGEQAIALLFSAPLNVETIKQYAQIRTGSGEAVDGQWELGKNPRLAVFRGVKTGRYTVVLQPQIADAQGFMLGTTLQGPVYIQGP